MSYLRILGRPKIERDTNGLRKITRRYVVQGEISEKATIESEVFLPLGTPDVEYDTTTAQDLKNVRVDGALANEVDREDRTAEITGAYLVQQSIDPGQNLNEVILTRVYQELDNTNEPVQVGGDEISVTGEDRLSLKRTYLVKNPFSEHYQAGRVGVDFVMVPDGSTGGAKCILGAVQSKETEVFTEFIEQYYEDGVLSEKVNYVHGQYPNHRLEIRTLRGVAKPQNPPDTEGPGPTGPWFEVESSEGPGNADYGQVGKTVWTVKYAKGYGLISTKSEIKGKPPNTLEVKTIQFLTGENGTVPTSAIPNFTRETFRSVDEKDGYELHTIRGVDVSNATGVVDAQVSYKHGYEGSHKLEMIQAVSYGQAATIQNVIDFVYPSGDPYTSLGNFVIISEAEDTKGEFDVFKNTIVRGNGLISEQSEVKGKPPNTVEVKSIKYLTEEGGTVPTSAIPNFTRQTFVGVDNQDGYDLHTIRGVDVSNANGVVDAQVSYKHGDEGSHKLELVQAVSYGQAATVQNIIDFVYPSGDPYTTLGNFVIISEAEDTKGEFDIFKTTVARGDGLIGESTKKVGLTEVSEQVFIKPNGTTLGTALGSNELSRKVDQKDGYEIVTITVTTALSGVVDEKTDEKNNGSLTIVTRTQLGATWDNANTPAGYDLISERNHSFQVYPAITKVFAKGDGVISESSRKVGMTTVTETVSLHPPTPALSSTITGNELTREVKQLDGHQLLKVSTTTEDSGIVDEKTEEKNNGALTVKTILQLGSTWDGASTPSGYVEISVRNHRYDVYPAITKVYAKGTGVISESSKKVGMTTVTETVSLHPPSPTLPHDIQGDELNRSVDQKDGYQVLKVSETTQDSGVVDERTEEKHNGALIQKSITQIGSTWDSTNTPAGFTEISVRNHRFDIYPAISKVFAKGTGEISRGIRKVGQAEVTEITTLFLSTDNVPTTLQANELKRDVTEQDGYIIERISVTTSLSGLIDSKTEYRNGGALTIYSFTQIGSTWDGANTPTQGTLISHRDHTYDIYSAVSRVYAHGNGTILVGTREEKTYQINTYVILGGGTPPANAFEVETTEEDGYSKVRYSTRALHTPTVTDSSFRISQGVKYSTTSSLDLDHTGAEVSGSKSHISKDDFVGEITDAEPDSWDEQSWTPAKAFVKKHSVTTVTESGPSAPATGDYVSYNQVAPDIWHKTTTTYSPDFDGNSVILSETTVHRAGYYLVTTVSLGAKVVGGVIVEESEQTDQYGITTYSVTSAYAAADSYNIYKTHAFTVPGMVSATEHGVVEQPPYTVNWPCVINVEYSTTATSYTTYTPPSATASMHVRFHDGSDDFLEKGGGSNYTYHNGLSNSWASLAGASFMGRAIRDGDANFTGRSSGSWSNSGNCLGSSSREVLSIAGLKIFRNEKITTM
jgi:hypothetical protein